MPIDRFEDVEAWQAGRKLARSVYAATKRPSFRRDFPLTEQIRRSAISVMANVAEGFDSRSDKEFLRFLAYAYRSVTEVQSHLHVARDQDYMDDRLFERIYEEAVHAKRLIGGFIRYLSGGPGK